MASAILTVLYPDEFTVCDERVCAVLDGFYDLATWGNFEKAWSGYLEYRERVELAAPAELSHRDKDRWLWGKSTYEQLVDNVMRCFGQPPGVPADSGSG